ncbi:MAG: SH3 domain-containing protein [Bdellovibrio sp.]|nr:SH3 domain-containing protein [Bdellovibrio sp.]
MISLIRLLLLICLSTSVWAAQKGVINSDESDIYSNADFDSDILDNVRRGETYLISDKTYGAFYKIKLKSGKIGYIPDNEVDVNGKPFKEKAFQDEALIDKKGKKVSAKNKKVDEDVQAEGDNEPFDFNRRGLTLQMINYHEDTMGSLQVDDLLAIGYKSISDASWEVIAAFKAPKYYAEKTGGSAQGIQLWADYGINNTISISNRSALRYSGAIMTHFSQVKVSAPAKSYDLQDMSLGLVLEAGLMLQIKKVSLDFSAKYFFDRNNYGGLGLSLLF